MYHPDSSGILLKVSRLVGWKVRVDIEGLAVESGHEYFEGGPVDGTVFRSRVFQYFIEFVANVVCFYEFESALWALGEWDAISGR